MLTKKSFETKLADANKIFTVTVEKLKTIKTEISEQIASNNSGIDRLTAENTELETMVNNASRQIEQIGKLVN